MVSNLILHFTNQLLELIFFVLKFLLFTIAHQIFTSYLPIEGGVLCVAANCVKLHKFCSPFVTSDTDFTP